MIVPRSNDHFGASLPSGSIVAKLGNPTRSGNRPSLRYTVRSRSFALARIDPPSVSPAPKPLQLALKATVALDFSLRRGLADRRKLVARALGLVLPLRQDALSLWSDLVERCSSKPFVDG